MKPFSMLLSVALMLSMLGGCAALNLTRLAGPKVTHATAENPVVRMVCVWEPSEGKDPQGQPARGFAGQIMFFTQNDPAPVVVDGDVRIYEFDDYGTAEETARPIHQFDFNDGAWSAYLRDGMLGPTYHVFIPYMRRHSYQVGCQLRVRLTPKYGGQPVFSPTTNVVLTGSLRDDQLKAAGLGPGQPKTLQGKVDDGLTRMVQQAQTQSAAEQPAAEQPRTSGIRVETIHSWRNDGGVRPVSAATSLNGTVDGGNLFEDGEGVVQAHYEVPAAEPAEASIVIKPAADRASQEPAAAAEPRKRFRLSAPPAE